MELVSMHSKLNEILCREMLAGRRFVLAIDEAQNLDSDVLETIRLLSNFETSRDKMLQILLIGQPQLARKLATPELEQLQQRISVFARLEPFGAEDTARYVAHRLQVAGYEGPALFSPGALRLIAEHSQGIPRKINGLCFSALSLGCAMGRKQIDVAMMEEVIADRDVESFQRPRVARRVAPAPAPVTTPSAMLSYPESKPEKSFSPWALGTVGVVACAAIVLAVLFFFPGRIDSFFQASSEAWSSIRSGAASRVSPSDVKSDSRPVSSSLNVQAAELPNAGSGQSIPPTGDAGTNTVIVQPGETLRQVILRTMGDYNGDTIEQIRKLNPSIPDLDHLRSGQVIRFPWVSEPVPSVVPDEGAGRGGKNQRLSHPE
jgi:AAA domain